MAITITMLRAYATVVQGGNLADAAMRLGRTPAAISMTIKQMEEHLGARLFETERKNNLTLLGREIYDLAQQQLKHYDETIGAIETMARAPKGLLRIAAIPSVVHHGLPRALQQLAHRHPALQIDLQDADTDVVIASLLRAQADVGLVSGRHDLNGIRCEPLFEDSFGLVASPQHPLMQQAHAPTLGALSPAQFVRNPLCSQIDTAAFQTLLQATRVTARNTLSLISFMRTGHWMTVLPESVVPILPGHLAFRKIKGIEVKRQVSLLIRERNLFPDIVQEFTTALHQQTWTMR